MCRSLGRLSLGLEVSKRARQSDLIHLVHRHSVARLFRSPFLLHPTLANSMSVLHNASMWWCPVSHTAGCICGGHIGAN